jgi:expansin (peptidoglycan-binding protein)
MSTSAGAGGNGGACKAPGDEYTNDKASVTFYTFSMGADVVNCGFKVVGENPDKVEHVETGSGEYFGALNTSDYNDAATCGACIEVTRDGTRKVVITVVDQCPTDTNPKCTKGHIDLSKEAFLQIGAENEGYLGTGNGAAVGVIGWHYVACPVAGDVTYELKDPTNQYWNQILVEEHRYAISKVEAFVNGSYQAGVRQSYNYWQVGDGSLGMPPYKIRATDVNGDTVEASLALSAGDQASSAQFPACQ